MLNAELQFEVCVCVCACMRASVCTCVNYLQALFLNLGLEGSSRLKIVCMCHTDGEEKIGKLKSAVRFEPSTF